jgi:hypothetical protein
MVWPRRRKDEERGHHPLTTHQETQPRSIKAAELLGHRDQDAARHVDVAALPVRSKTLHNQHNQMTTRMHEPPSHVMCPSPRETIPSSRSAPISIELDFRSKFVIILLTYCLAIATADSSLFTVIIPLTTMSEQKNTKVRRVAILVAPSSFDPFLRDDLGLHVV